MLGAGASRRLGQPKQLLDYRGKPLLQAVVDTANGAPFDQVIVAIGGASPEVQRRVSFGRAQLAENVHFTTGCSSSIVAALDLVDPEIAGLVLLLGDQPGVTTSHVVTVIGEAFSNDNACPLAVGRYDDGRGHPFWFAREVFDDLRELQGDKAVWKLLESGKYPVHEVALAGDVPLDVDTWEDYERLLEVDRARRAEIGDTPK